MNQRENYVFTGKITVVGERETGILYDNGNWHCIFPLIGDVYQDLRTGDPVTIFQMGLSPIGVIHGITGNPLTPHKIRSYGVGRYILNGNINEVGEDTVRIRYPMKGIPNGVRAMTVHYNGNHVFENIPISVFLSRDFGGEKFLGMTNGLTGKVLIPEEFQDSEETFI